MSNDNYGNKWANNKWANPKWGDNSQPFTPPFLPDTYAKKYADKYGTIRNYVPDSVLKYYDQAVANLRGAAGDDETGLKKGYLLEKAESNTVIKSTIWLFPYDFAESNFAKVNKKDLESCADYIKQNIQNIYQIGTVSSEITVEAYSSVKDKFEDFRENLGFAEAKIQLAAKMNQVEKKELVVPLGTCAFLVSRSAMGRISEVTSRGGRTGYFNVEDIEHTDKDNTPAHEFGHIMGLEDRYHFFMRINGANFVVPLATNPNWGKYGALNENNKEQFENGSLKDGTGLWKEFGPWNKQIAMYLPSSYDENYETINNLFSSASPTLTHKQWEIILSDEKRENIPNAYKKNTFFGGYSSSAGFWDKDWQQGHALFVGEIEKGKKKYKCVRSINRVKSGNGVIDVVNATDELAQNWIRSWGHPFFPDRARCVGSEEGDIQNSIRFSKLYPMEGSKSLNQFLIELPYV